MMMHRRLLLPGYATALFLAAALFTVIPADAEEPEVWVQENSVPLDGQVDSSSVRVSSGYAVWRVLEQGVWRIKTSRATSSGSWSAPVALSEPGAQADSPALFADSSVAVAAWRVFDGTSWQIQASFQWAGSDRWTPPTTFAVAGRDAADPLPLAAYSDDRTSSIDPMVFWRRHDGSHWRLQAGYVVPEGGPIGSFFVTPPGGDVRDVRLDTGRGTGSQAITWSRFDGSHWRAQATLADDPEGPWTFSPSTEDALDPSLGADVSAWRTLQNGHWRVHAFPCEDTCRGRRPVFLSPADVDTEGLSGTRWLDFRDDAHSVFSWREFDGQNWRVAVRIQSPVGDWSALAYLSQVGVDASAPSIGRGDFDLSSSVVVAWTEEQGTGHVARAAVFGNEMPPEPTTLSASDHVTVTTGLAWNGVAVGWVDQSTGTPTVHVRGLDAAGPITAVHEFGGRGLRPNALVRWSGYDDWSEIAGYDLRLSAMRWNAGRWTTRPWVTDTTTTSKSLPLSPGTTHCVASRGRDTLSHRGRWTYPTCLTTPTDDRTLIRRGRWQARSAPGYYRGTYLRTTQKGASLVLRPLPNYAYLAALVAVGPGNGKIRFDSLCGNRWWRVSVENLDSVTGRHLVRRQIFPEWHCPGLRVTVLTAGKPVRIDGIYVIARPRAGYARSSALVSRGLRPSPTHTR